MFVSTTLINNLNVVKVIVNLKSKSELSSTSSPIRKIWIDAVRGFAITLVVIGHVIQTGSAGAFDFFMHPLFLIIYTFHMPLFMLISGIASGSSLGRYNFVSLAITKVRTLVIPIIIWSVLGSMTFFLIQSIFEKSFSLQDFIKYSLRGAVDPSSVLWFPWILFVTNLAAWLALSITKKYGIWVLISSVLIVWLLPINSYFGLFQMKWLYPFFILGLLISKYGHYLQKNEFAIVLVSVSSFVVLVPFWKREYSIYISQMEFDSNNFFEYLGSYIFRYSIAILGSVACIGIIRIIGKYHRMGLLAKLGIASMGIYCLQTFLVMILGNIPSPHNDLFVYNFVYTPVMSLLLVTVCYLISTKIIERNKVSRVLLLGGR